MLPRILVTGASGFIGCNVVAFLKKKGYFVRAVDIEIEERIKNRGKMFKQADQVMELDLRVPYQAELATHDIDWVFHFASNMGGVGFFNKYNYYPFMDNMTIDINMLRACEKNKVKRLFYASSSCIYPEYLQMEEGKIPKLSEKMIYPADCSQNYGWEKLMMLRLCEEAQRLGVLDARVGIFSTIYGVYQEMEGERMKFPTAISTKALQAKKDHKPIEVWGNGKQLRSYLYIEDAMECFYRVMTMKYNGPVNIASEEDLSVDEATKMVCELVDIPFNIKHDMTKPSGVLMRSIDNSKFYKEYKYHAKYPAKEGFRRLIEWIKTT